MSKLVKASSSSSFRNLGRVIKNGFHIKVVFPRVTHGFKKLLVCVRNSEVGMTHLSYIVIVCQSVSVD